MYEKWYKINLQALPFNFLKGFWIYTPPRDLFLDTPHLFLTSASSCAAFIDIKYSPPSTQVSLSCFSIDTCVPEDISCAPESVLDWLGRGLWLKMFYQEYMTEEAAPFHEKTSEPNWLAQAYTTLHYIHEDRRRYTGRKQQNLQLGNEGMITWLNGFGCWMKWGLLDEWVFAPWMRNLHWLNAVFI